MIVVESNIDPGEMRRLMAALTPDRLFQVLGRAFVEMTKRHLAAYGKAHPNQLGGRSTKFYETAARQTTWKREGNDIVIAIVKEGLRLRVKGGVVRPGKSINPRTGKPTRFLTIPAQAKAHGKRAGEFNNLVVLYGVGGRPVALVEGATAVLAAGGIGQRKGKKLKPEKSERAFKARDAGVLFWLVRQTTHKGDASIIPAERDYMVVAEATMNLIKRRGLK